MFTHLVLKNFQIHKSIRIDFDPSITCVVGDNGRGKTALLRALYWIAFNKPRGIELIRHGAKFVRAELGIDDHVIVRKRTKSKNLYILDGSVFAAVKSDVPSEVSSLLNISEYTFQNSLDAPLWFRSTPGQVARELNGIVDLQAIDNVQAFVAAEVRRADSRLAASRERRTAFKAELEALAWVPGMAKALEGVSGRETRLAALETHVGALQGLIKQAQAARRARKGAQNALQAAETVLAAYRTHKALETRLAGLGGLVGQAMAAKQAADPTKPAVLTKIEGLCGNAIETSSKHDEIQTLIEQAEHERDAECQSKNKLASVQRKLDQVRVCPACDRPM